MLLTWDKKAWILARAQRGAIAVRCCRYASAYLEQGTWSILTGFNFAEQCTVIISLVNTPFWVFIWILIMVEPTIKLVIVESMAKEAFDRRPPDGDMIRRSSLELHDALLGLH